MAHWIFQSNPKHFDLPEALKKAPAHGNVLTFLVTKYEKEIMPGDTVYLYFAGKRSPGLYATATVLTCPDKIPQEDYQQVYATDGPHPWDAEETLRVRLKIEQHLDPPVTRRDICEEEVLATHQLFRAGAGTNFSLKPEQADAIKRLIAAPRALRGH
jgi:predicted RNA-binding protein with PUA-like domain